VNWTSIKVVQGRIGGTSPSVGSAARMTRNLKPAAYDPDSVDIDNDGWHQEGTTAQWFGLGRNHVLFRAIAQAFRNEGGDGQTMAMQRQFIDLEVRRNAPPVELSDEDTDIAFIAGVLTNNDPTRDQLSVAELATARRFLKYRQDSRNEFEPRNKPFQDLDGEITPDSDGSVKGAIKRLIEARKKRREERESRFQEEVDRMIDDPTKDLAIEYKDRYMTDMNNAKESYDEIYRRIMDDYAKKVRRPSANQWETSPEIREWERMNPEPNHRLYDSHSDLLDAMGEWNDARSDKVWELSRPAYQAWVAEVEKMANEEFKRIHGSLPGEGTEDLQSQTGLLTDMFTFSAMGRDGQQYDFRVENVVDMFGSLMIQGGVYDKDGNNIGTYERSFKDESRDVHHDHLIFNSSVQNLGLGSIFNARNEQVYKLMGFESISTAGLSNDKEYKGATHWPKNGFDWADDWERDKFLGRIQTFIDFWESESARTSDQNVTIVLKKQLPDGTFQNVSIPLFASAEEVEMIRKMVDMARSQDFNDPNRLVADDFLQFQGAEEAFKVWKATINYTRSI